MWWKEEKEELGREVVRLLYEKGLIKTWFRDNPRGWTLVSGLWSPFYIQLRPLSSYPELLGKVGHALGRLVKEECKGVTKVVGVAMAGIPLACAVALQAGFPALWTREREGKNLQNYGEHTLVEGVLENGDRLAVVDDLATKFDSKLAAIEQLNREAERRGVTVECKHAVVLLDREQGAAEVASQHGVSLHCLVPFKSAATEWLKSSLSETEYKVLTEYLRDEKRFQFREKKLRRSDPTQ